MNHLDCFLLYNDLCCCFKSCSANYLMMSKHPDKVDVAQVLSKLLPIVLDQLKTPHDKTRRKVGQR